ncbi:MAG: tetratricopeptide repeat protein [Proteobacteria bacterium]|nr:tetratricopeptide repeat protein [Pseudomonadota bacterium]NOG61513.1 tetratricopeptide repeat protein [Pseudomonadota bacterium]
MFSFFNNKRFRYLAILFLVLLLGACAGIPQEQAPEQVADSDNNVESQATEEEEQSIPERILPKRPDIELTEDILFKVLVAEIAGQRGKIDIAVENYLELARTTRDPVVVERATRVAIYARNNEAAYEAAQLWLELDPKSPDAHQVLTVMTLRQGNIDQALHHLEIILEASKGQLDQKLWMIANFLGREEDQAAVMLLMERLMENHMDDADAMYAFANVSARMGNIDRATSLLERVLELKPENEAVALTYIALLQKSGEINTALKWLETALNDRKDDFNLRMAYARLLTEVKRFDDARDQFKKLSDKAPDNVDVLYALGLLHLQINKLDEAEQYFLQLSKLKKHVFDSNYYLARIAEEKDELEKASDLYQGVHGGANYFDARVRLSLILAKQGDIDKALTNIRSIQKSKGINRLILIQAEGEILTEIKRYQEAMDVYNKAIEEESHPDLLYSRAMLAEKMDRLDILEADLKAILEKDENNATALNALGYTLADRTDRYEEAYAYIKRAYEISPSDFYILDSLGWVLYRMGKLDEAVAYLQQALELRNDPEIAAHLGEVFWVMGNKKAAKEIWETALKGTPTDHRLLEVIERFKP